MRAGIAAGGGAALPAPVFNMKKRFDYRCALSGERRSVVAGRMECTMQARAHAAASCASPLTAGRGQTKSWLAAASWVLAGLIKSAQALMQGRRLSLVKAGCILGVPWPAGMGT